jgi:hypothetical protein
MKSSSSKEHGKPETISPNMTKNPWRLAEDVIVLPCFGVSDQGVTVVVRSVIAGASRTLDHAATDDNGRAAGGVVGGIQPATPAGLNRLRLCLSPDFQWLILNEARQRCVRIRVFAICSTEHDPPDESPPPKKPR